MEAEELRATDEIVVPQAEPGLVELEASSEVRTLDLPDERLLSLDVTRREIGMRIVPFGVVAVHPRYGPLLFEKGAFGVVDPSRVRLRMDHADPPTGLGTTYAEQPDGAYLVAKVSKTQRGDEQLTLAVDGVSRGVSVGYSEVPGRVTTRIVDGRATTVYGPNSAVLREVSTTWQPTFAEAGVQYVLSKDEKGSGPMAEPQEAPVAGAAFDSAPIITAITDRTRELDGKVDRVLGLFESWRESQRREIEIPAGASRREPKLYHWAEVAVRMMRGQAVSHEQLKALALDDVVTSDNPGLVPDVFSADFDDLISNARPFLASLRRVATPATGLNLSVPKLTQRATAGSQAGEKQEITGAAIPKVDLIQFPYQTVVGGADIAMQMIMRGDQSTFDLIVQELAEAYAYDCDWRAIDALLNVSVVAGPQSGGTLDPEALTLGAAWQNSIASYRRAPTHIWMNSSAVAAFIDAKNPSGNGPLYSQLAAAFTAGSGAGGVLSGLTPIYVPALDDASFGVDVIVGPARSYIWAEDAARRLEVDVPSKAGRDLALVGGIFPGPRFGDAFTTYTI